MDEYIKREEALNALLNEMVGTGYQSRAMDAIKFIPSANVVPKSESDLYRKQVDELEDELASTYDKLEKAKAEVSREIFAEIEKLKWIPFESEHYVVMYDDIAELKKKYTEEHHEIG